MVVTLDKRSGSLVGTETRKGIKGSLGAILEAFDHKTCGTQLELSRYGLGEDDMDALFKWLAGSPCRRLGLEMNGLNDSVCSNFGNLLSREDCELRYANLSRNPIGQGVVNIFEGLRRNVNLITLDLSYCKITDEDIIRSLPSIKANRSLILINLIGNDVSGPTMGLVAAKMAENQSLYDIVLADRTRETSAMQKEEALARKKAMYFATLEIRETLIDMRVQQRMQSLQKHWVAATVEQEQEELDQVSEFIRQAAGAKTKGKKKSKKKANK